MDFELTLVRGQNLPENENILQWFVEPFFMSCKDWICLTRLLGPTSLLIKAYQIRKGNIWFFSTTVLKWILIKRWLWWEGDSPSRDNFSPFLKTLHKQRQKCKLGLLSRFSKFPFTAQSWVRVWWIFSLTV